LRILAQQKFAHIGIGDIGVVQEIEQFAGHRAGRLGERNQAVDGFGKLGGAALDVVTTEPLAKDSPLIGRDNVILTPHTAFYSVEALEELQTKCASDVARVLSGEKAIYPISA